MNLNDRFTRWASSRWERTFRLDLIVNPGKAAEASTVLDRHARRFYGVMIVFVMGGAMTFALLLLHANRTRSVSKLPLLASMPPLTSA